VAKKIPSELSNLKPKISKLQSLRVLVVEDSEDDVLLIIRELKKGGYDPVYERVETAAAMKKALQEKQWDIILCDYKLPKFNATSAIAVLKETNIDIPLIIVSGTIGEETAVECMRLGAQDYIMKDNLSRLCPAIARELEEAEVRNKQKQTESALRESEESFRLSLDDSPLGIRIVTAEGETLYANRAIMDIYGYDSIEELRGTPLKKRYTPESYAEFQIRKEKRERGEIDPSEYEISIVRKAGEVRHVQVFRKEVFWNGARQFQIIYQDITEHKQAEEELYRSQQMLQLVLDNIPQRVFWKDRNYVYLGCNKSFLKDAGLTSMEEIIGKDDFQLSWKKTASLYRADDKKVMKNNLTKVGYEEPQDKPDGSKMWLRTSKTPLHDRTGHVIGILGTYEDITEQKRAEEKLLQSEAKYRSLVENAQEGIYQSTREGRHVTLNPAFAHMLGYDSPEEVMATITNIAKQLYVYPQDREKLLVLVEENGSVTDFETEFYRKDGSRIWVSINMHAVRDDQGCILYYQGIDQDITERKKIEAERQENIERLRKSLGATINAMAVTVETRDPYTAGHQRRVADLAHAIAVEMNLKSEQIDGVRMASMIHDIGKISIPSEILTKPTQLTNLEFNLIKTHPISGYNILKDIELPWPIARIVLEHHERIDGSGYPNGLKGEQILLASRIIAIADVVEAISSHRPYRAAHGIDAGLDEITKNRGILYDPDLVDACLRLFREKNYNLAA
jgi:PAS domain S-box-containing protein